MSTKLDVYGLDQVTMTAVVRKLENKGGKKIGLDFLPFYDSPTEETMWDIVRAVNPAAAFRAVDGEAELVGRQAFDRAYADVVSMARKERFNTSDLRKIREAGMLPVIDGTQSLISQMAAEAKKKIRMALERCKNAIDNRLEWMQINALLGKIDSPSGSSVKFSVDYGIGGAQSGVVPSVLWSTVASATPLDDIQSWQTTVLDACGILPDTIIMSRKALRYIMNNTAIRTMMQYTNPMMSIDKAREVIQDNANINIILYDTMYTDETGATTSRFLAENKIIMLPSKNILPEGVGDTARVGHPLANYTAGYYSWSEEKKDPYGVFAGVGLDAFPRIIHPEVLFNATVF
jgi:hypothetical protein